MIYKTGDLENFSVIGNECLREKGLSAKAKGVYAYLMTLPDDWKIHRNELLTHFTDGKHSIQSAFRELKKFGYVKTIPRKNKMGKFEGWDYEILLKPDA